MQALYLAQGRLSYRPDHPMPARAPGEALIRVLLAGICSTDLEMVKGYAGGFEGVLGHEFVGVVEEADDAAWLGRRVVGSINVSPACQGRCGRRCPEHCPDRVVLGIIRKDGVFADYVTLPLMNLLAVPAGLTDEQAVFTEPLAAALRITEQVAITPETRLAVIGPGRLGLLIAQVLRRAGGQVVVLGRRTATPALVASLGLVGGLVEAQAATAFDVVVEATGNAEGLMHALRLVRPEGTLVLKSTYAAPPTVALTALVVNELRVVGSRCGPFAPALELLAQGAIQVAPLIDGCYPLAEGEVAFERAAQPGVRKLLLRP